MPAKTCELLVQRLVVGAVDADELVECSSPPSSRIWASSPGPPTAAISASSEISRPSTSRVACRIEARMIPAESMTVPSRSKKTTRKAHAADLMHLVRAAGRSGCVAASRGIVHRRPGRGRAPARSNPPPAAVRPASRRCGPLGLALEHRPDERAHHVAQEGVGGDLELEHGAAAPPPRADARAENSCWVSVGVNARKSCSPGSSEAARTQALEVERSRMPERATRLERRGDRGRVQIR